MIELQSPLWNAIVKGSFLNEINEHPPPLLDCAHAIIHVTKWRVSIRRETQGTFSLHIRDQSCINSLSCLCQLYTPVHLKAVVDCLC